MVSGVGVNYLGPIEDSMVRACFMKHPSKQSVERVTR